MQAADAADRSVGSISAGVRRIHIVGGPGTGKSTLASRLGRDLGIRVYSLDTIAYEGPDFTERDPDDRRVDVQAIAESPEWIAEGIHLGWTVPLLERAELIIWLDNVGWTRSAMRIVQRFSAGAVREARSQRGARKFTRFGDYRRHLAQLMQVLVSSRDYYKPEGPRSRYPISREVAERELSPHRGKVVRCRSNQEVRRLVASLAPPR